MVSDNFSGGLGSWTAINGTWSTTGGVGQEAGSVAAAQAMYWSANAFNRAQTSLHTWIAANYDGAAVLLSGASQPSGYAFFGNGSLYRMDNGVLTLLGSGSSGGLNDVVELRVDVSGNLTAVINGTTRVTAVDTTYTSGSPGMVCYGSGSPMQFDDWQGTGEIAAAAGVVARLVSVNVAVHHASLH